MATAPRGGCQLPPNGTHEPFDPDVKRFNELRKIHACATVKTTLDNQVTVDIDHFPAKRLGAQAARMGRPTASGSV